MNDIYNYVRIDNRISTSGQPTEVQLRAAAKQGIQLVINLATLSSDDALEDEAALVRDLGMGYIHIPVVWENPTVEDFRQFESVLQQSMDKTILIHCAANYRVTVFFSLYAMKHLGWTETQADELMASIWQDGPYPVWDAFIKRIRESSQ